MASSAEEIVIIKTIVKYCETGATYMELDVMPLMQTLAQLSYVSVMHLGVTGLDAMHDQRRLQVGKIADVTFFYPATAADRVPMKLRLVH